MPSETELIEDLISKLAFEKQGFDQSSAYYEAQHRLKTIGLSTPPEMHCLTAAIGWPRMYLDAIEERLDVEGFRVSESEDTLDDIHKWWQANNLDEESGLGHLEAMIYKRSYVTIASPDEDEDPEIPNIQVESPLNLFAETDLRTRKVKHALRYYQDTEFPEESFATLYLPDSTGFFRRNNGKWVSDGRVEHDLGIVPVVPLVNRERLGNRNGQSEITPELRSFTDAAARAFMNMQAAAELMAVPQRILFGVDQSTIAPNGTPTEVLSAYLAQILAFEDQGSAFQFSAAELRNFVDLLGELAKHVASYTGLPPQYLTFSSDNPASAEAIKSSESRLVKKCERKARMFGGSWEHVMRIARLVMTGDWDGGLTRLETVWRDPSTPTYAAKADAAAKLYANGMGVIPKKRAWKDMGYTIEEIAEMDKWAEEEQKIRDEQAEKAAINDLLTRSSPDGPTTTKTVTETQSES